MSTTRYEPISGSIMFKALVDKPLIIPACNIRIPCMARGIFKAAKDTDSPVIIEIAKAECNLNDGYIGINIDEFASRMKQIAAEVEFDAWSLHADHISVKTGTREEIEDIKKMIKAQIDSGFTSFAVDASHLFNFDGDTVYDRLKPNIDATIELAQYIDELMTGKTYGLEVEVGEIGVKDSNGMVVTSPEEATVFITALNDAGVYPDVLAIANGSTHGNVFDEHGKATTQVSIDIDQTKAIVEALKQMGSDVRIAQHGVTGTPLEFIKSMFPHGDIIKGNIATYWQNIVLDVFKLYEPKLYSDIYSWIIENYSTNGVSEEETFGKYAIRALRPFHERIEAVRPETIEAIDARIYADALLFVEALKTRGMASYVRRML
ncbi:MAG: class II fructose-bisphosphate aldolase [Candidatus Bathyarchaeota archaeon]|nr:class II fructose-bisphosphate aldolase [Candidatus Bathyarchaeota archaeon]